jgi:hypothetical protein
VHPARRVATLVLLRSHAPIVPLPTIDSQVDEHLGAAPRFRSYPTLPATR